MDERQLKIVKKYNEKLVHCIEIHLSSALIDFSEDGVGSTEMRILTHHSIQTIQSQETPYAKTTKLIAILKHHENGFGALVAALKFYGMGNLANTLQDENSTLKVIASSNIKIQKPWNAPLKQTRFVGRDYFLQQLHTLQNTNVEKVKYTSAFTNIFAVCVGLGGVGKSSLALEYVYRTLDNYEYIFWVPATTREDIENCLAQLGVQLCLQAPSSNAQIWRETLWWLQANPGWLIVLDDAPNFSVLQSYIPHTGGCVLVTSRYTEWPCTTIEVTPFARDETMEYLKLAIPTTATSAECATLSQMLGGLPLALSQATAYMRKLGIGVQEYLARFKSAQRQLLDSKVDYHGDSVYLTWNVSVQQAKSQCSFAAELLQFCSLLNETYVPKTLICEFAKIRKCSDVLEVAQAALYSYSLMSYTSNSRSGISMHPLVQAITKFSLSEAEMLNYVGDLCISISNIWPKEPDLNHDAVQDLYPSLKKCLQYKELEVEATRVQNGLISDHLVDNMEDIAESAYKILCKYMKLKILLEKKLTRLVLLHGPDHIMVASTVHDLGNAYGNLGDYEKMTELLEKALVIKEKHCGSDHDDVARLMHDLGVAYAIRGDYNKQKELLEKALLIKEKYHGTDHAQDSITFQQLGNAYGSLGNCQEMKEMLEKALLIKKKHYGTDHIEVAFTLHNLGVAYGSLGDYQNQKELLEKALLIEEKQYGTDHIEVACTLHNLGNAYSNVGDHQKKKELLQKALLIEEKHYGSDHIDVARILHDLGAAYGNLGDHKKKRELLVKALVVKEKHYGFDHVQVAIALHSLGNAYGDLGDYQRKKELLEEALVIEEKHYGPDHVQVASILRDLGRAYGDLGDYQKQKELLEKALVIEEKHYGPDHVHVAIALHSLGNAYGDLGDYQKKRELLEKVLVVKEKHYGFDHVQVAIALHSLGNAFGDLGDYQKKKELLEEALVIEEKHYGPDHVQVAITLHSLGNAYGSLGDYLKKRELLEQALVIQEKHYGADHVQVAIALHSLGNAYGSLGDYGEKRKLLDRALVIKEKHFGPDHVGVKRMRHELRMSLIKSTCSFM